MKGKVVLVTGATAGIGQATAIAFADQGAKVVVAGRRQPEGEETVAQIEQAGGQAIFVATDVSDEAAVSHLVQTTVETFGHLDYAINNAGYNGTRTSLVETPRAEWDKVISTNLTGTWLCMKYELKQMMTQGSGAIVNMSSILGLWGSPNGNAYIATKHAILGLTKTAALEYAHANIRVNALAPGGVRTAMLERSFGNDEEAMTAFGQIHPLGRLGTSEEMAQAIIWLCSDEAAFITGHTLVVDGGFLAGINPILVGG